MGSAPDDERVNRSKHVEQEKTVVYKLFIRIAHLVGPLHITFLVFGEIPNLSGGTENSFSSNVLTTNNLSWTAIILNIHRSIDVVFTELPEVQ